MKKDEAIKAVDRHVEPKACFITQDTASASSWRPLDGTGCAHWAAHQLGLRRGTPGSNACMAGYILRVSSLVSGMALISKRHLSTELTLNCVWTNAGKTHNGLVVDIERQGGEIVDVTIRHCSSRQGGVFENSWKVHFKGEGMFFKPPATVAAIGAARMRYDRPDA